MTFDYTGPHENFSKVRLAFNIVSKMEDLYDPEDFHGYMDKRILENIIARELFGHPVEAQGWSRVPGQRKHVPYLKKFTTAEEDAKIAKVISRMETKGVISVSKSGEMVKPLMTTAQWFETVNA